MSKPPKKRSSDYKLKLVLDVLKGEKSLAQIASENEMHPKQIQRWKNKFLEEAVNIFEDSRSQQNDPDKEKLLHIIDELTLELDFLKKKLKRNN